MHQKELIHELHTKMRAHGGGRQRQLVARRPKSACNPLPEEHARQAEPVGNPLPYRPFAA